MLPEYYQRPRGFSSKVRGFLEGSVEVGLAIGVRLPIVTYQTGQLIGREAVGGVRNEVEHWRHMPKQPNYITMQFPHPAADEHLAEEAEISQQQKNLQAVVGFLNLQERLQERSQEGGLAVHHDDERFQVLWALRDDLTDYYLKPETGTIVKQRVNPKTHNLEELSVSPDMLLPLIEIGDHVLQRFDQLILAE